MGSDKRNGTLSLIGAVSPPGGDFSEPVVQATLRVVKVFWGLDDKLAFARHFPAINWLTSYSLYQEVVDKYANENYNPKWSEVRRQAMAILQREAELEELVRLVGMDALPADDRLLMQAAKMIREDFLHQNAFDELDTYTSMIKQFHLLSVILHYYDVVRPALQKGVPLTKLLSLPVLEEISKAKLIPEDKLEQFDELKRKVSEQLKAISS
jgi:V/A-type H+-transporting ATPase subunit A